MNIEEITKLLATNRTYDLDGAKEWYLKMNPTRSKCDFLEAATESGSDTRVSNLVNGGSSRRTKRSRAFYDFMNRSWSGGTKNDITFQQKEDIRNAMVSTGLKEAKKALKGHNTEDNKAALKKLTEHTDDIYANGVSINFNLGYGGGAALTRNSSVFSLVKMFEEDAYWGVTEETLKDTLLYRLPNAVDIDKKFLVLLKNGDKSAVKLASFGYQNVYYYDKANKKGIVVFRKLPKVAALIPNPGGTGNNTWRRTSLLHNMNGPAYISPGGSAKRYALNSVEFGKESFEESVDVETGKLKVDAKEILKDGNVERRRVLLSLCDRKDILRSCKAKLIDRSKRGNELYQVDIGLPTRWNTETNKSESPLAKILKFKCPSTDRVYYEFVKPDETKADEAQAHALHMDKAMYAGLSNES